MLKGKIKRIIAILLVIIVVAIIVIFMVTPSHINISRSVTVYCTKNGANKILNDNSKWMEWWPGKKAKDFEFNSIIYKPQLPANNSFRIMIGFGGDTAQSNLNIITAQKDSVFFLWSSIIYTGNNPLKRLNQYKKTKGLANDMDTILARLKFFLEQSQNIYGININSGRVKDTLLISLKKTVDHTPTTQDIYLLIDKLNNAITANGAQATNYPMLNITNPNDSNHFLIHVAIPISKPIKETNEITIKKMVPGNILITNDITGGNYTINKAFEKVQAYVTDFNRVIPAIPFQSLVTNRMQQPDTSKWVTKIYCPVY